MTHAQETALRFHCRLAGETFHHRFRYGLSIDTPEGPRVVASMVLTVNSRWE